MERREVNELLFKINKAPSFKDLSLLNGGCGTVLFAERYARYSGMRYTSQLKDWIEYLVINDSYVSESSFNHTFCNGIAGIYWFYSYLSNTNLIDKKTLSLLCHNHKLWQKMALRDLGLGNYDFLHGALGIAYYFLYNFDPKFIPFFEQFFIFLNEKMAEEDLSFFYQHSKRNDDKIILGLAHGLSSILKFSIECYKRKICKDDAFFISQKVLPFILNNINSDRSISYFSSMVTIGEQPNEPSVLSWCYGDLGISFVIYQAGVVFCDKKLVDFALKVLLQSTQRKTEKETFIHDACFCHGSAGAAHIYNKLYSLTGLVQFKIACDYWINRTVNYAEFNDSGVVFRSYYPDEKNYSNIGVDGILNGSSGIGLVLLSYLTGDFSWDYCVMLN